MSRFGRDSKRIARRAPKPGPQRDLPGTIEGLTGNLRELNEKRDRLVGDVEKLRRPLAEAEDELDQLQLSWWPWQPDEKQRLELYRQCSAPILAPSVANWTRPKPASGRSGPHWSGSMP
jgi:hypothetical protein